MKGKQYMKNEIKYPRIIQIIPALPNLCVRHSKPNLDNQCENLEVSPIICVALTERIDDNGILYQQVETMFLPQDEPVARFTESNNDMIFCGFEFISELERSN